MASKGTLRREGETLVIAGVLDRAAATALWPQALAALPGAHGLDLRGVELLDSAGLALLAELADRVRASAGRPADILGSPPGLAELSAAYRLGPGLDFQASPSLPDKS